MTAIAFARPPIDETPIRPQDVTSALTDLRQRDQRILGQILLDQGAVDPGNLFRAVLLREHEAVRLGEILLAHGWVAPEALTRALCVQWRTTSVDLATLPPDPRLIDAAGADLCLTLGLVPWRRVGGVTYVATSRPDGFEAARDRLPADFGQLRMLLCTENQAQQAVLNTRRTFLIRQAENRVPDDQSCRTRNERRVANLALAVMLIVAASAVLVPVWLMLALTFWVVLTLIGLTALKLTAFIANVRADAHRRRSPALAPFKGQLPLISVMVPLFGESDIAGKLVGRLSKLRYPRELTDILLVIEETDQMTRTALEGAVLPDWMRVVIVPDGPIKTKPRALNYALDQKAA
ncbi:MAG: hypothetical protein Q4G24_10515 [Paracoccus sp. (in: a-proteobacteria)]|uniref:GspE/PulE/PilB domain-containing protein n=1 Tax=Paracoccus sp. TaxID=267 RepID=UPI0026DFBA18|nr:hypothetical protein [Paracoccus sp. (in: a-proteobacteria)]MDO5621890.1 hypothetical protein [Paracoccus sp. (in: a-proteobacteria)]